MSWSLCLDTSSRHTCLALGSVDGEVHTVELEAANSHDEELAVQVKLLLHKAGVEAKQIGEVIAGAGPGSFTGLKIGFSFGKGFAWGRRIPFYSYCSFRAVAFELLGTARLIAVVADARGGEFFLALFRGEELEKFLPPLLEVSTVNVSGLEKALWQCCRSEDVRTDQLVVICPDQTVPQIASLTVQRPHNLAVGLWHLHSWSVSQKGTQRHFNLEQLVREKPLYVRKVAARTIVERNQGA